MMAQFARGLFFFTIVAISVVALLVLLPFLKEGFSRGEIPLLLGGAAFFLAMGFFWWLAVARQRAKAFLGWAVLSLPLAAYLGMAGALGLAYWKGERLSAGAALESFREEPLVWPGFDGPVGWKVAVVLRHPGGSEALLAPPEIRMGPSIAVPHAAISATLTWGGGYFKDAHLNVKPGPLVLLKTVGFQHFHENTDAENPIYRFSASKRLSSDGLDELTYYLYPGHVEYLRDERMLCLASETPGLPACADEQTPEEGCVAQGRRTSEEPIYHDGSSLSALWAAFGQHDMTADLSQHLTGVMRSESSLQDNPDLWVAIQKRLEPQALKRAGYDLCPPGDDSHTAFRICYCR